MNVKQQCPNCGTEYVPELADDPDFNWKYRRWKGQWDEIRDKGRPTHRRPLIQELWPDATPMQREQLMTGLCSDECWNKYLGQS